MSSRIMKKAQSLPLNTIVIAILVVIVLLVIIVFFTTNMGDRGKQLEDSSKGVLGCKTGTILIPTDKYSNPRAVASEDDCSGNDVIIRGADTNDEQKPLCCVTPKTSTSTTPS